jgi:asparagine synthase (glutamine-hydrolysing)
MCGIYGALSINYKNIGQKFSNDLTHRGPDDKGLFLDQRNNLALGHNRLSILDLSNNAHQPMMDESKSYVLVFNGEIYNFKELRKELVSLGYNFNTNSDTEIVLKSFIHWGEPCIQKFRGMFAFCIFDRKNKSLFLARDRFGIKPLIYSFIDDQFIFSSELKPFLNSNFVKKKLSYKAVSELFQYGSVKQPSTMIEGIYHLLPAHCMTVKIDRNYKIKKYYDYIKESRKLPKIDSYNEAVLKVREELEVATKYHMVSDVDVGAFLSSGVDSTAVVALMKLYSDKQINTFSIGFKNKTYVQDETAIASRTAKQLGCNHRNIKIDDEYVENIFDDFIESIDQPSIDGMNSFIVSKETAKYMKVALTGTGGDEVFAGYTHFKFISQYAKKKNSFISLIGQKLNKLRPNRFMKKYDFVGVNEAKAIEMKRCLRANLDKILINPSYSSTFSSNENLSSIQIVSKHEIDNYMLNTLLRDNDVLSMAHSLEVRPILLDHKLVELAFSLNDNFKVRNDTLKSVLIDSVKDIIPSEVYNKRKQGFAMPFINWMNKPLNKKFNQIIFNPKLNLVFNEIYLKQLQYRVKSRELESIDWLSFIFASWLVKYSIHTD